MTAAYRLKGLGWFATCVVVVLGCYLVSLRVAAERVKLEQVDRAIADARGDLRGLETEFNTRSNLAQLERWNGNVLALAAPTPAQLIPTEAALAQINFRGGPAALPEVQTASLVMPSAPVVPEPPQPDPTLNAASAPAQVRPAVQIVPTAPAASRPQAVAAAKPAIEPGRRAPTIAAAAVVRPAPIAMPKRTAVASLDRKLLSDTTLGDLASGARAETANRR